MSDDVGAIRDEMESYLSELMNSNVAIKGSGKGSKLDVETVTRTTKPITRRFTDEDGTVIFPPYLPHKHPKKQIHRDILIVGTSVFRSDLSFSSGELRHLNGNEGKLLESALTRCQITDKEWAYTALVPFCTDKLSAPDKQWGLTHLQGLIKAMKPLVILCLGKPQFDLLADIKLPKREVSGAFFNYREDERIQVYCADSLLQLYKQQERLEAFDVDLATVRAFVREKNGVFKGTRLPEVHTVIKTAQQLRDVLTGFEEKGLNLLSVDCEWGRNTENPELPITFVDGYLRSLQFCADPVNGYYIMFRDDKERYVFDVSYEEAGKIISDFCTRNSVMFAGHNIAADFVWMQHRLGIDVEGKAAWDTLFAEQTISESRDLKLERLAMRYTSFGRYDKDLLVWKKKNKKSSTDEGYSRIPDEIIVPYGIRDVLTVFRAWPKQYKVLEEEGLLNYYTKYRLPFVTDGFVHKMLCGIPVIPEYLDQLREDLNTTYNHLLVDFKKQMQAFSRRHLMKVASKYARKESIPFLKEKIHMWINHNDPLQVKESVTLWFMDNHHDPEDMEVYHKLTDACAFARDCVYNPDDQSSGFKSRSQPQMRLWLFNICGYEPIKTTKVEGIQMAWEKVEGLPPDRKDKMKPAVDKSTLAVYASKNKQAEQLMAINAVGNLIKAFLKQPDMHGNEQGIHKWIASSGKLHSNFMLTESGRPRSFNPNVLNTPKAVGKSIDDSVRRVTGNQVFSIRSCYGFKPEQGYCWVDTDLQTAELVALAVISGDHVMLGACTDDDPQYALKKEGNSIIPVRISIDRTISAVSGSDEEYKDLLVPTDHPDLLRNPDGSLIHPKRDQHWELAEAFMGKPRELLSKKIHRDALGKTANFSCIAENQMVTTDHGLIPIQDVQLHHKVWDGVEFVSHEGVIYQGEREIITYGGLTATPDHKVWVVGERQVEFIEACWNGLDLVRTCPPDSNGMVYPPWKAFFKGKSKVYDILNAGPRHRFTVNGILVSNCSYGATPSLIERRYKEITGMDAEPGMGERVINAWGSRNRLAWEYLENQEKLVDAEQDIYGIAGLRRRFVVPFQYHSVSESAKRNLTSGMRREARNFPMQNSVAEATARAHLWLIKAYKALGLKARNSLLLYDALTTMCPVEERFVVRELHKLFISTYNVWRVSGRELQFGVDTDFSYRLGHEPSEADEAAYKAHRSLMEFQSTDIEAESFIKQYDKTLRSIVDEKQDKQISKTNKNTKDK